MVSTKIYPAIF